MEQREPRTEVLAELFGSDMSIRRYVDMLRSAGVDRGLIGPREAERVWDRHILNCQVVSECIPAAATVLDVGSGAGLPGVVLALARPDLAVTLLDPMLRRTRFLAEVVHDVPVPNAEVLRGRAESLAGNRRFDIVTARAVAPLGRLVEMGLPLLRPGGALLAIKGANAIAELDAAAPVLRRFRVATATIERVGVGVVSPATTVVRIESGD